ncbi:MAG: glutamate racemase [Candidatus Pacebacteria bacterium]|nr:glutamate racemase [Candidatus Paceibacterota bacterium]
MTKKGSIGVFDSGVGGLWILKHLKDEYKQYNYFFVGDQAHVPYGLKTKEEIKNFAEQITNFLKKKDCSLIIVACNTASGVALKYLREKFPEIIFVGMEPAVKTAALNTQTGKIGVLATKVTFEGELYNSLKDKFGQTVQIFEDTCDGLVNQVEKNELSDLETRNILERAILPMIEKEVDSLVLGCTHYPFVTPLIKDITKDRINIIDPTMAIVGRVGQIIYENQDLFLEGNSQVKIFTTGDIEKMQSFVSENFDKDIEVMELKLC